MSVELDKLGIEIDRENNTAMFKCGVARNLYFMYRCKFPISTKEDIVGLINPQLGRLTSLIALCKGESNINPVVFQLDILNHFKEIVGEEEYCKFEERMDSFQNMYPILCQIDKMDRMLIGEGKIGTALWN